MFWRKIKVGIAMLLFAVISFVLYKNVIIEYNYAEYREKLIPYISVCGLTGEITDGTVIEQTFLTELDVIEGVYLRTATYKRENNSYLNISMLSMEDELLGQQRFSVQNAKNNEFTHFIFDTPINVGETKQIKCRIISVGNFGGGWQWNNFI